MFKFDPKHKFNNKKMETPDGVFDSKGEWQRWLFLKDAERRGAIKDLERQVKFVLLPTQYREEVVHLKTKDKIVKRVAEREVTYTADFVYRKLKNVVENQLMGRVEVWEKVVEDFKGFPNDRWPLKKAMMLYFHGIAIREVKKPTESV
jgi:hypothetical protein